ncbi:baseplate hub subunit [Pectobacterium phage POP12]|nr:baseplate hub subunit [Pectobacterium phage POP12]
MSKVVNRATSIKIYQTYEKYIENSYIEVLPALISLSEKTTINGSSIALMQIYDAQKIYETCIQPIIQVSFQYNETIEQHYYGLMYSNVDTDDMGRSVLRLNLAPVHKSFSRMFSRSFSNNATEVVQDCITALYEKMKQIQPTITSSNVRVPVSCLSGFYDRIFDYVRDNSQGVETTDFCYLWEDGSGIYLRTQSDLLAQTPLKGYKNNVDSIFVQDYIVFTKAEYITYTDNTTQMDKSSFFSMSLTDKKLYQDILADTDTENNWIVINRNAEYQTNFQIPDKESTPFQAGKFKKLSSFEKRIKFELGQGRMDLKVGALLEIEGNEYTGRYIVVECIRDVSKDFHIQTIECIQIPIESTAVTV